MLTVKDLLSSKENRVVSIEAGATVHEALHIMERCDIGAVLVMEKNELCGIFSERDYARKVVLMGRNGSDTCVGDVMVKHLITVAPEDGVRECMKIMTGKHVRHLPVVEEEKLIGIVTIGDVIKGVMEEQSATIHHLETYISGGYLTGAEAGWGKSGLAPG